MQPSKSKAIESISGNFKWPIIIVVALISALTYHYFRNRPSRGNETAPTTAPQTLPPIYIRNPIELKDPSETKLGPVQAPIEASVLFDAFMTNERQARTTYVGKTFLVTGVIGESFELTLPTVSQALAWYNFQLEEHISAGIMLIREKSSESSDEPQYERPMERRVHMDPEQYERRYKQLLESREPNFNESHKWSYDFYSDDFSAQSYYGGVYCMFASAFRIGAWGYPERKRKITAKCRVRGFEKGGLEAVDDHKGDEGDASEPSKRPTKPRVILVGCEEIRYEMTRPLTQTDP